MKHEETDSLNTEGAERKKKKALSRKRVSWISGVRIGLKRILLAVVIMLPLIYIVSKLRLLSSELQTERKAEMDSTMVTVMEQYANVAFENMMDIAKTITKNDKVYELLNESYYDPSDYSDAYQKFRDSRTLAVSDSNSIRSVEIYTENMTVLNGGMINRLTSSVRETEWYYDLERSGKNTILFCDSITGELSLIRRFDLYPLRYGDALLKIDFSMPYFRNVFNNINYKGKIYISCNRSLLYSNDSSATYNNIFSYGSGELGVRTANYYSSELSFYVYSECEDTFSRIMKDPMNITCAALVFLAVSVALYMSVDTHKRVKIIREMCSGEREVDEVDMGQDEIGRLHQAVSGLIGMRKSAEGRTDQIIEKNKKDREKYLSYERALFDFDSRLSYMKLTDDECVNRFRDFDQLLSFTKEIRKLEKFIRYLNSVSLVKVDFSANTEESEPDDMFMIQYAMVMTAACIIKLIKRDHFALNLSVIRQGPEVCVKFTVPGEKVADTHVRKITAAVSSRDGDVTVFRKGSIYNSLIRIKKYYGDDVRFVFNSDTDTELKMFFRAPKLFRKYID